MYIKPSTQQKQPKASCKTSTNYKQPQKIGRSMPWFMAIGTSISRRWREKHTRRLHLRHVCRACFHDTGHLGDHHLLMISCSHPGLNLPTGIGPDTAVTGQTGPDRFRFGTVSNRSKFKIQIWIKKSEKNLKNFLKILQVATNLMVSIFFQIFVNLVYFAGIWS